MALVKVVCKFSGDGARQARARVALDLDRDGRAQDKVTLEPDPNAEGVWSGRIETPSHTINMLILVGYEMSPGTSFEVEVSDLVSGEKLWARKEPYEQSIAAVIGYMAG